MAAFTWAGLIEWQRIKVQLVVQVGLRRRSRGASCHLIRPDRCLSAAGFARVLVSIGPLVQSSRRSGTRPLLPLGWVPVLWCGGCGSCGGADVRIRYGP